MKFELKDTTVSFLEFTSMADGPGLPTLVQKAKDMVYREVMAQIEATPKEKYTIVQEWQMQPAKKARIGYMVEMGE